MYMRHGPISIILCYYIKGVKEGGGGGGGGP